MKSETITILRPSDFDKLSEFINYYLFGQIELPKLNPYKEYILSDSLLEFLANFSEEIKIVYGAENLYLIKVLKLFVSNSDAEAIESLNECYNKSHIKKKISHFTNIVEKDINIKLDIFIRNEKQEIHNYLSQERKLSLEILTFLIHQLEGILSYIPEKSCSISALQYQQILDNYLIDKHKRSSLIEAFKKSIIEE